jgi:acetyl-CoA carboxylase/biotin carboxylase 2
MTTFILGSFDDNSSDEDLGVSFRESSRKNSRASLGTLFLEAAGTASEADAHVPTMR